MQIRCSRCQRPFALGKQALLEALEELEHHKLHHYNLVCPHCGRLNRISQEQLQRAIPQWKASIPKPAEATNPNSEDLR